MSRFWPLASTMSGTTDGSSFTLGNKGHATVAGFVSYLWYYRSQAAANGIPQNLKLWDVSTGTLLATIDPASSSSGTGWKAFPLSSNINLDANQVFAVSAYWPAGRQFSRVTGASKPTPESPLEWETNFAVSNFGSDAYPATAGTATCEGVDVTFTESEAPEPGTPPLNADIENALVRWFSSGGDNTRTAEAPYQTWLETFRLGGGVDGLVERLDADGWPVVLGGVNKADLPAWLSAAGTIISAIAATADTIKNWTDAPTLPAGGATSASITALSGQLQTAVLRTLTDPPDVGWTLDDTVPFVGPFVVDAPFDRLFVNITTIGSANGLAVVGGLSFLSFAWWWAPLRSGAIVGRYHTSRALAADLYEPGRRCPGALVVVPADFEGEYELWRYTG